MSEIEEAKAGCETGVSERGARRPGVLPMTAPKETEVVYLDRARAVASLVHAIQADPEAMRIICELRDSGCSKEQFAEKFKRAWDELDQEPRR